MDGIKQRIALSVLFVKGWFNRNFSFWGLANLVILLAKAIPDFFGRKDFWSTHLAVVWAFLYSHSTVSVIVACALFIWLDHRRVIRKRGPKPHDPKTLKGRVLQLRDDLKSFVDSLPMEAEPAHVRTLRDWTDSEEWVRYRSHIRVRCDAMHYGYELKFSERTRNVINELGEQSQLNSLLPEAFNRPLKGDAEISEIINQLGLAADKLPN